MDNIHIKITLKRQCITVHANTGYIVVTGLSLIQAAIFGSCSTRSISALSLGNLSRLASHSNITKPPTVARLISANDSCGKNTKSKLAKSKQT